MEDEYLAPTEISFTTPFKRAFGPVGNGNDSYDGRSPANNNGNESDLDFLDNFQNLALSGKKGLLQTQEEERSGDLGLNQSDMGVAESKENVQEEIPSFVNFGDAPPHQHHYPTPKSPIITTPPPIPPKKIRQPEFIEDILAQDVSIKEVPVKDAPEATFVKEKDPSIEKDTNFVQEKEIPVKDSFPQETEPFPVPEVPKPRKQNASIRPIVQASPEPVLIGSKTPHPELKRLQDQLLQQERDFQAQVAKQERIVKEKELQLDAIYKKIDALQDQNKDKPGKLKKYEAKIAALSTELENLQSVLLQAEAGNVEVINEREQYYADLRNVENAYTDLMGKYQRAMESMSAFRSSEDEIRSRDEDIQDKIEKRDHKYDMLKKQVQESVEAMYQEYDTKFVEKKHENENLRVRLMRLEMRVNTLENDLEQKSRENSQLHTLCDEIISGKVAR